MTTITTNQQNAHKDIEEKIREFFSKGGEIEELPYEEPTIKSVASSSEFDT